MSMRMLWHSVPPRIFTGYGVQASLFVNGIADGGHEIAVSAAIDQYHNAMVDGVFHFASGPRVNLGNDFISGHILAYKPDIIISMVDSFIMDADKFCNQPWYAFAMVDSAPVHPARVKALRKCTKVIAPTHDAQLLLANEGIDSYYVPLAFNPNDYFVTDQDECRKELSLLWGVDIGDRFLAVNVSANMSRPSRKNFGGLLKAWSQFVDGRTDNPLLYIHTETTGMLTGGEDLMMSVELYGVKDSVIFASQYQYNTGMFYSDYLRKVYNAASVLCHTAMGEGFGLPIVEAQACGCPVIAPCFGAMKEVCKTGICSDGIMHMYDPGAEQIIVNVEEIVEALENMADGMFSDYEQHISDRVAEYRIDNVMKDNMLPTLKAIESEVKK